MAKAKPTVMQELQSMRLDVVKAVIAIALDKKVDASTRIAAAKIILDR